MYKGIQIDSLRSQKLSTSVTYCIGHVCASEYFSKLLFFFFFFMLRIFYFDWHAKRRSGEPINAIHYRQNLMYLSRALHEKRPEMTERGDKVILQCDNDRPHLAVTVKNYKETLKWEALLHTPYSLELAQPNYMVFRGIQNFLVGNRCFE